MRKKLAFATLLLTVAAAFVVMPLSASGDSDNRVVIGVQFKLNPGPPLTGVGNWSACCGINDSGATNAVVNITSVKNDFASIAGTHTFEGTNGTFTDRYTGTLGPLSSPRQIASGRWRFTGGTGAYANIHGDGTFLLVVDGTTGLATGVHEGRVRTSDHNDEDH